MPAKADGFLISVISMYLKALPYLPLMMAQVLQEKVPTHHVAPRLPLILTIHFPISPAKPRPSLQQILLHPPLFLILKMYCSRKRACGSVFSCPTQRHGMTSVISGTISRNLLFGTRILT